MAKGLSKVTGIDYAWEHVPITALVKWGATFVCRYISNDSAKDESLGEAQALANAGIWSVLVFETTARRAATGYASGVVDAKAALRRRAELHVPADRPIYFAVDYDASGSEVMGYFRGVRSVLGDRTGVYAGYKVVKALLDAKLVKWAWQTYAWSGGRWDSRAQLQQYHNDISVGGVGCDADRATTEDYGQWKPGISPNANPTPTPDPTSEEDNDMPTGPINNGHQAITPISLPKGRYKTIGFIADNGLQGLPPARLRVAVHQGGGTWHTEVVAVDSHKGQTVVHFPNVANTDGISVRREDDGNVLVSYEVS
jgi:hypothetical protein